VFILEYYFASKSFDAVYKTFRIAYPDKEVSIKTTVDGLVRTCWDTVSVFVPSGRRWVSAVKLFVKFFLMNRN
jgi:hypothetical protein